MAWDDVEFAVCLSLCCGACLRRIQLQGAINECADMVTLAV